MRRILTTLAILSFLFGCAPVHVAQFTEKDFSTDIQKILPQHDFSFSSLKGRKIHVNVSFSQSGDFRWQKYNFITTKINEKKF